MRSLIMIAAACVAVLTPLSPNAAQTAPEFSGSVGPFFRDRQNVAVPAYHVVFVTQQQATAVGGIGARTRLNTVLTGIDEATMRRIADAAHADLVAQLRAAGMTVLGDDAARALTAGVEAVPGNRDTRAVGAGITIGRSVRRGYAAYGAQGAPLLAAYHAPLSATGALGMSAVGASMRLGRAAREADAVAVIPALTIDYINMEASTGTDFLGRPSASATGDIRFAVRAVSGATFVSAGNSGPGYMQGIRLRRDLSTDAAFATVAQGGAEVREGSMTPVTDGNYQTQERARGDAVVADPARWEALARDGYRAFNAGIVAAIQRARR